MGGSVRMIDFEKIWLWQIVLGFGFLTPMGVANRRHPLRFL
jgi:hypothetical protein